MMMQLIKTTQRVVKRAVLAAAVCLLAIPGVSRADLYLDGTVNWDTDHNQTTSFYIGIGPAHWQNPAWLGYATLNQTAGTVTTHSEFGIGYQFGTPAPGPSAYNMSGTAVFTNIGAGNPAYIGRSSPSSTATWSLTDGASATVANLIVGNTSTVSDSQLLLSGAATFTATSVSFGNSSDYISFASGSTATLTVANKVLADYQALVTAGNIRVDGVAATWSKFQVSNHTLSLAPPPTKLAITVPPTGTVNSPFSVTVQAKDAGGTAQNVTSDTTVTLTKASGVGALSGTQTGVISNGTSSVTISGALYDTADTMTLTASATSGMTLTPITSSGITFAAEYVPPTKLTYKTVPTTGTAGTVFSVTVEARDSGDIARPVSSDTTVTLSQASGGGTLSGAPTGIIPLGDTEVTISTLVYSKSDTMTLTATPTLGMTGLTPVTSGDIVFSPGALDHFTITPTITSPQTAGTPITGLTLTALDAYANTCDSGVNAFTGAVTYSGTAGITGTSDAFTAGVLSGASVTPTVPGTGKTFIITGSDKTGTSTFDVVVGNASKLAFGSQPNSTGVGDPIPPYPLNGARAYPAVTVLIQDAAGNLVTSDTSSVTIGGTTFTGDSTLTTNAVGGVATFSNLKPTTAGSAITLTASDGSLTGATSSTFTVGADVIGNWYLQGPVYRSGDRVINGAADLYIGVGLDGWYPDWIGSGTLHQTGGTITTHHGVAIGFNFGAPHGSSAYHMSGNAVYTDIGGNQSWVGRMRSTPGTTYTWSLTDAASGTVGNLAFSVPDSYLLLSGAAAFTATSLAFYDSSDYISFAPDCTATLTVSGLLQADYEALVTAGNIRVDGVQQTDFSKFKVTGTGGNTLSLYIPPQGTVIMFF